MGKQRCTIHRKNKWYTNITQTCMHFLMEKKKFYKYKDKKSKKRLKANI